MQRRKRRTEPWKPELDSFQAGLLDKTGLPWVASLSNGIEMDYDKLTNDQFDELLGAGCFTFHQQTPGMHVNSMHKLHFNFALKHAKRYAKSEDTVMHGGNVLKTTMVVHRFHAGLDILVYPILKDGVDTGMFKIAWGDA